MGAPLYHQQHRKHISKGYHIIKSATAIENTKPLLILWNKAPAVATTGKDVLAGGTVAELAARPLDSDAILEATRTIVANEVIFETSTVEGATCARIWLRASRGAGWCKY